MNILVLACRFYPELSPRAFRTFELVKEFCSQNHKVKLILPNKDMYNEKQYKHSNLITIKIGDDNNVKNQNTNSEIVKKKNIPIKKFIFPESIKDKIIPIIIKLKEKKNKYFPPFYEKEFMKGAYNYLKKDKEQYDFLISIGLPIEVHLASAFAIIVNKNIRKTPVTIAEYGDPYFFNQANKYCFLYFFIDFFVAKVFKYICIPTEKALNSYKYLKKKNRIKIIPQGINIAEYRIQNYRPNKIITFAYAGVFYRRTRNPKEFLDYLYQIKIDFRFYIYTIEKYDTLEILKAYESMIGSKIIIKLNKNRENIIYELSKMDFLINFENSTSNQSPSKVIDYALTKRPICSISTGNFSTEIFDQFIKKDYSKQLKININDFDIKNISNQFLSLV